MVPTTTSAPSSPGGASSVRASRSAATATSAPRSCAASISGARSRTAPEAPGYCSSTPKRSPSGSPSVEVGDDDLDAERLGAGAARPRWSAGSASASTTKRRRPPCGCARRTSVIASAAAVRLVEQRRVGRRQAGQVGDHGLEVEQRLEPALARSPAGTACRRCTRPGSRARCAGSPAGVIGAVVAEPDHRRQHRVAARRARAARRAPRARRRPAGPARAAASRIAAGHGGVDQRRRARRSRAPRASWPGRRRAGRCAGRRTAGRSSRSDRAGDGWCGHGGLRRRRGTGSRTRPGGLPLCHRTEVRSRRLTSLQSCLARAVRAPERFRGGVAPSAPPRRRGPGSPDEVPGGALLLRRPSTGMCDGLVPSGVDRRGQSYAARGAVSRSARARGGAASSSPGGRLVGSASAVRSLGSSARDALDLAPDAADGDAEHALAALEQVDDLVGGGALVDAGAVAHQRDRVRSSMPRSRRCWTAVRICCSETPVSSSRLTTLRTRMSRKE